MVSATKQDAQSGFIGRFLQAGPLPTKIMRARNVWPGSTVIRITMPSLITRVPPVTALRSPLTDDRSGFPGNGGFIHASDAFYHLSIQGMISPASHNTLSPLRNSEMETISSVPLSVGKRAFT